MDGTTHFNSIQYILLQGRENHVKRTYLQNKYEYTIGATKITRIFDKQQLCCQQNIYAMTGTA